MNQNKEKKYSTTQRFSQAVHLAQDSNQITKNKLMTRVKPILLLAALLFVSAACNNDDELIIPPSDIELTEKSAKIIESDNRFGLELFHQLIDADTKHKNMMMSPLSVSLALAMAYNGAEGNTREEMEQMLHKLNLTPDEINQSYKTLVAALKSHDLKVELDIANGIFYHKNYTIKNSFLNTNKEYYSAEVRALDFANSASTLKTINDWVKNKTREKIDKIIEVISPYDVMVLVNAVYFNGEWTYQFEKDNTADRVFFYDNGSSAQLPTMMIKGTFNYYRHNQFEMIELPYGGGKYSMLVLVPGEGYSANEIARLMTPSNMNDWTSKMNKFDKKVFLPRFEFKYESGLVDHLKKLGMKDAFVPSLANFKGITDEQNLFISEVKHKSYIKVDERGTEAAAVTGIVFETTSVGSENIFAADRPFVFAIKEKDTNALLFIGKLTDPKQK